MSESWRRPEFSPHVRIPPPEWRIVDMGYLALTEPSPVPLAGFDRNGNFRNSAGQPYDPQPGSIWTVEEYLKYEKVYRDAGRCFLPALIAGSPAALSHLAQEQSRRMFAEAAKAEKSGVRSTHSGRRLAKSIQREALDSVATALADYIAGQSPSETGNMAVAIDSAHPLHGAVRGLEASYGGVLPAEILPKWRLLLRQSRTDDEDADTTAAEILGWINKERSRMNGGTKGEASATTREKRFKIALSFPGERREFVREVADTLRSQLGDGTVLYDEYFEAEFARPGLDTYLQQLYRYESELIVVFVCAEYDEKQWCGLEWRAIRDLIKAGELERIMPVRFDSTEIPGLFSNDGYIWIGDRAGLQIADLIIQRLQVNQRGPAVSQSESIGDRTRRIAKIIDDLPGVVLKAFRDSDAQARVGVLKNLALETAVELAPVVGWLERRRPAETVELFKHRVFGVLDEAVACVAIEIPEYAGGEINRVEGCGNSAGLKKVGTLVVFKALVADSLRAWASEIDQG